MKEFIAVAVLLAAASFASADGVTSAPSSSNGTPITVETVDTVAKVLKTDPTARTLTIKDPEGKKVTIGVPPELPLDQIKKGSLLDVRYVEAAALAIGTPGVPPAEEVETVTLAPEDGTPGEVTATTKRLTGMVQDIDRSKRELTVKGLNKKSLTLKVVPDDPGFDDIKIGDTAVIEYTEAVALSAVKHAPANAASSRL